VPAIEALLDTDVLVEVLRGRPEAISWPSSRPASAAGVPVIVWMELIQGARDQRERDKIINRLAPHSIVHLEAGDSQAASGSELR